MMPVMGLFNDFEKELFRRISSKELSRFYFELRDNNIYYAKGILTQEESTFRLKSAINTLKKSIVMIPTTICPPKLPPYVLLPKETP